MNDLELKAIWLAYDQKLERLLEINFQQLKSIQHQKADSHIRSFIRQHMLGVVLGIAWILFLAFLEYHMLHNIYFAVSVGLIIMFNIFAVAAYLRHVTILQKINVGESITETQRKLALVITSDTQAGRILLLQTPLYCTFYYTDHMVQQAGPLFWSIQALAVTLLSALAIYGYRQLSPENRDTRPGRLLSKIFVSRKLQKAQAFLTEIDEFKKEKP
jgi:hypothetical protein